MKKVLGLAMVLSILLITTYAFAGESLVLYDNFKKPLIDPVKWYGSEYAPSNNVREATREIIGNALHITSRGYGGLSTTDFSVVQNRLRFVASDSLTAVKFTLRVKNHTIKACTTTSQTVARVNAGFVGYFFNTGTPIPGNPMGDMRVEISVGRKPTDAANIFRTMGVLTQCSDNNCIGTVLKVVDLGIVKVGQNVNLYLEWDKANHQFIAQRDNLKPVRIGYDASDTSPPASTSGKRLFVGSFLPNCGSPSASISFVDAFFTNVYVNSSAAAAPEVTP